MTVLVIANLTICSACKPIRGQYSGHVICLSQSEASIKDASSVSTNQTRHLTLTWYGWSPGLAVGITNPEEVGAWSATWELSGSRGDTNIMSALWETRQAYLHFLRPKLGRLVGVWRPSMTRLRGVFTSRTNYLNSFYSQYFLVCFYDWSTHSDETLSAIRNTGIGRIVSAWVSIVHSRHSLPLGLACSWVWPGLSASPHVSTPRGSESKECWNVDQTNVM